MDIPPSSGRSGPSGGLEPRDVPDQGASCPLGKCFGIPLLIAGAIVCCAALVVVLFGGPAAPPHRSLEGLLQSLEAGSGRVNTGLLPTREQELWKAAFELSLRLEEKDDELSGEQLSSVAVRLAAMIEAEMESLQDPVTSDHAPGARAGIRSRRLAFLVRGLGGTERPEAIDALLKVVRHGREPYLSAAIAQLGNLHELPGVRRAIDPLVEVLAEAPEAETRLVACTALSVLAGGDDQHVIAALAATRLASVGEVAWSAALGLARLGSPKGKSTLLDLLDRSFLEGEGRYETHDETGGVRRYRLQAGRVDEILIAAISAAANLDDAEIRSRIEALASDPSPAVSHRAAEVVDRGT